MMVVLDADAQESLDWMNEIAYCEMIRELGRHSRRIAEAQDRADRLRSDRDTLIRFCRNAGRPVAQIARDAELSRESVYQALRRTDG